MFYRTKNIIFVLKQNLFRFNNNKIHNFSKLLALLVLFFFCADDTRVYVITYKTSTPVSASCTMSGYIALFSVHLVVSVSAGQLAPQACARLVTRPKPLPSNRSTLTLVGWIIKKNRKGLFIP